MHASIVGTKSLWGVVLRASWAVLDQLTSYSGANGTTGARFSKEYHGIMVYFLARKSGHSGKPFPSLNRPSVFTGDPRKVGVLD